MASPSTSKQQTAASAAPENPAVKSAAAAPGTSPVKKPTPIKSPQIPLAVANLVARGLTLDAAYKQLGVKTADDELL